MRRTLIKSGYVVTMDRAGEIPGGDVLIEGEKIVAVGKTIEAPDADVVDASQMIVLPGLINGHLHTWQTGLRGLAADWTVAEYIRQCIAVSPLCLGLTISISVIC